MVLQFVFFQVNEGEAQDGVKEAYREGHVVGFTQVGDKQWQK